MVNIPHVCEMTPTRIRSNGVGGVAAGQGKMVPGAVLLVVVGRMYPAGCRGPWRWKIPEADSDGRAVPDPGLHRRRGRVGAGFEPEGGHLVFLVDNAQCEVMQGAAKDGVGAVLELLE
jgi:hypothetical protein